MRIRAEVCICGGGPAGLMAAVASARTGAKTVLLEKYGFAGGMATAGLVGPISKFNFNGKRVVGGLPLEFVEMMQLQGGAITNLQSGNIPFDSEVYKSTALDLLLSAGVESFFNATVCGAGFSAEGVLSRVCATSGGSFFTVEADCFVDCTGTGALIAQKETLWRYRSTTGHTQPLSLIFKLAGVDTDRLTLLMSEDGIRYANQTLRPALTAAVESDLISGFGGPWTVWGSTLRPGIVSVNCTRYGGDATDPADISRAECVMRRDMLKIIEIFRRNDLAFTDAFLVESAVTAGYRESRELNAVYRVTADDLFAPGTVDDTIAFGAHPVDRHIAGSSDQKVRFLTAPYAIPYRCMISAACPNLLVAGALVAAEPVAYASMRVQAQCMAMGQAAGTAAAMCALEGESVHSLSCAKLRDELKQNRVIIDLEM